MSSPMVPREKLSAYQRWELHSFDGAGTDTAERRQHADRRNSTAQDLAKQLQDQAYQTGLAEGMRRGSEQAAGEFQRLQALVAGMQQLGAANDQRIASDVLAIVLEIARQMTRRALQVRPELIVPVVQDALAHVLPPVRQAAIALNPEDTALVREHLQEQLVANGWTIVEDPQVARGGCKLDTAGSHIDATAQGRWRSLAAALGQSSEWME